MEENAIESASWTRRSRGRTAARRFVMFLATLVTLAVSLIVLGALFPAIKYVGTAGTLFESFLSLHIVVAGLVGLLLALCARQLGGRGGAAFLVLLAAAATLGACIPVLAMVRTTHRYGAAISWREHLHASASGPRATPDQTVAFAIVDGKALSLDVYLPQTTLAYAYLVPPGSSPPHPAPVVMIHGGGYSGGARSDGRNWDRWLTARGYTVFDVEYRLDPPVTWNLAAADVACAMSWVAAHASDYGVDANRMLVAGQSAGAGLALQMAYGIADGTFTSSCGGTVPLPKAVFALYPPDDFAMAWELNTGIGPVGARALNTGYIGGSPQQFPNRYRAVSAVAHVREGLPPTLVAAGEYDHLVPFAGHLELKTNFDLAGVPNELVAIPYSDHAYDVVWGSLGAQITRKALENFLAKYLPATAWLPPPPPVILEFPQSAPPPSPPSPAP